MNAVTAPPLTVADYRLMPAAGPRYQLIEGDLIMAPAPNRFHQDISGNLQYLLRAYLEEHPIGKLYAAPLDVFLDEVNVYQPDLVFVAKARFAILRDAGIVGAPDLIVEILSPGTEHLDRKAKVRVYARSGVAELWLVDPTEKTVQLYDLMADAAHPTAAFPLKSSLSSRIFPELKIKLAAIFAR